MSQFGIFLVFFFEFEMVARVAVIRVMWKVLQEVADGGLCIAVQEMNECFCDRVISFHDDVWVVERGV